MTSLSKMTRILEEMPQHSYVWTWPGKTYGAHMPEPLSPQKRGNLCNEREQWQRNRQPVRWGLCCLCLFLTSSPKEMQIEAKRWTLCAARHSMSLVLWLEAPNPSRGQWVKPGELGGTLLRYFASLGSESILALWLWWRLGFQSEFLSRPPRPHIIVASIR